MSSAVEQQAAEAVRPIVADLQGDASKIHLRDNVGMPALLLACVIVLATSGFLVVVLWEKDPEPILGALFTALLTVAALIPAVIGLIVVERPSARLNHGRVLWAGPLRALTILAIGALVVGLAATLTFLALDSGEPAGANTSLGWVAVMSGVAVLELLPFLIYVLIQRSSAEESTQIIRVQVHRLAGKAVNLDEWQRQALLKEIRDIAVIEFRANDRNAVRQRMQGLALISAQEEQLAQTAVEELAFLGQHLILDRDLALDCLALLSHRIQHGPAGDVLVKKILHEYFSFWSQSRLADASPQVSKKAFDGIEGILTSTSSNGLEKDLAKEVNEFMGEVPPSRLRIEDPRWLVHVIETAGCSAPEQLVDALEASRNPRNLDLLARLLMAAPEGSRSIPMKAYQDLAMNMTSGLPHHPVASEASSSLIILLNADSKLAMKVCFNALRSPSREDESLNSARGGLLVQLIYEAWRNDKASVIDSLSNEISKATSDDVGILHAGLHWRLQASLHQLRSNLYSGDAPKETDVAFARLYLSFYVRVWDLTWQYEDDHFERRTVLRSMRGLLFGDLEPSDGARVEAQDATSVPETSDGTTDDIAHQVRRDLLETCCRKLAHKLERDEKQGVDPTELLARSGEILDFFAAQRNEWSAVRIAWIGSLYQDGQVAKLTVPADGDDRIRLFFDCAWLHSQGAAIFQSARIATNSRAKAKRGPSVQKTTVSHAPGQSSQIVDGVTGLRALACELVAPHRIASHQRVLNAFSNRRSIEAASVTPQQCLDFLTWLSADDSDGSLTEDDDSISEGGTSDFDRSPPSVSRAISAARVRLMRLAHGEQAPQSADGGELSASKMQQDDLAMEIFAAAAPAFLISHSGGSPDSEEAEAPWVGQTLERAIERWVLSLGLQSTESLKRYESTLREFASLLFTGAIPVDPVQRAAFSARKNKVSRECFGPIERLAGVGLLGVCVPLVRHESSAFEGIKLFNVLLEFAPKDERDLRLDAFTQAVRNVINPEPEPNGRLAVLLTRVIAQQPVSFSENRQFRHLIAMLMDVDERLAGPIRSEFDAAWNGLVRKFRRQQSWEAATMLHEENLRARECEQLASLGVKTT